ncbi:MAG TPA: hypothetical protein VJT72_07760 [Pseudonocardiaceae bacterium]|nr:hypothetical protein [Pseudonocardiaceae bacterium]
MTPWEDLADHWRTEGELQVYDTMTEQLDVPCLVIMPDEPWIEPGGFSIDTERYLAYAVTSASTAPASQRMLHTLLHFIRHHLPEGWDFVSAGAPSQREHQGATYMAAESRLTFNQCTDGDPYEGVSS